MAFHARSKRGKVMAIGAMPNVCEAISLRRFVPIAGNVQLFTDDRPSSDTIFRLGCTNPPKRPCDGIAVTSQGWSAMTRLLFS